MNSNEWLEIMKQHEAKLAAEPISASTTFTEKSATSNQSGQRKLRILPFSRDSFTTIAKKFYIHDSIARAINRADIPTFSAVEIEMGSEDEQRYPALGNYVLHLSMTQASHIFYSVQLPDL